MRRRYAKNNFEFLDNALAPAFIGTFLPMIESLTDAGIKVGGLCILGFPGETEDEAFETIDFIKRNRRRRRTALITADTIMRLSGV